MTKTVKIENKSKRIKVYECNCHKPNCIIKNKESLDKYVFDQTVTGMMDDNKCEGVCDCCIDRNGIEETVVKIEQYKVLDKSSCDLAKRVLFIQDSLDKLVVVNNQLYGKIENDNDYLRGIEGTNSQLRSLNAKLIKNYKNHIKSSNIDIDSLRALRIKNKVLIKHNEMLKLQMANMCFNSDNNTSEDDVEEEVEDDVKEVEDDVEKEVEVDVGVVDNNNSVVYLYQQVKDYMVYRNQSLTQLMRTQGISGELKNRVMNSFYRLQSRRNQYCHPVTSHIESLSEFFEKIN